jgi:signal transduction histidine kinase/CheY-like chemotaxis protein/HPt (histidine-containing phosphotransfer) domain-containing protein
MAPDHILESFLAKEGFALFEHLGNGVFRPIGDFPPWLARTWGAQFERSATVRLGQHSAFLENFLVDAEEFWKAKKDGSANSGNWIERGEAGDQTPLEAAALWLDGRSVLLIRNFLRSFGEQKQWLQTARDSLLAHERLMREIQKKEILLHCIIHDLSQPLSAMRGCFNCLTAGDLPADLGRYVDLGQRESQRQEQMIRGILEAFSGELAGQLSGAEKAADTVDLAERARHAVESFSAAFREKGVHLQLDPALDPSRDWTSIGDAPRVDRIFGNLLENAMRYTPGGTAVTLGVVEKGNSLLAFVDDEGPGLPKGEPTDKLFVLFAKGKDRPGKAGLGLYFCKMTVERWGGTIGAETRSRGGSRFWFSLPRAQSLATASKNAAAKQQPAKETAPPPVRRNLAQAEKPLRILVADDSEINRELAMELLRTRGHSTVGVSDGRQVIEALKNQRFDVVLMDEEMPEMGGLEATLAIRKAELSSGQHHAIIGLTGNITKEDEQECLKAGMDGFLSKPFDMHKLFQTLESAALGASRIASETPPALKMPDAPPEDVAAHLQRTTAGNEKLIRSLIKSFLADAPKKLSAIRQAISRKNAKTVGSTAHALKGAVAIFGAPRAVASARNLEAMGRAGNIGGAAAEFAALEKEINRLRHELLAMQAAPRKKANHRRSTFRGRKK